MFIDPIITQMPEEIDKERFVIMLQEDRKQT